MGRFLGALLLLAAIAVALKAALILLILAGLIFRTRATVRLLVVLAALAVVCDHPIACGAVAGAVLAVGIGRRRASG